MKHVLYQTGDKDAPEVVKDRNGEVVLGLCRICGRGEVELEKGCKPDITLDQFIVDVKAVATEMKAKLQHILLQGYASDLDGKIMLTVAYTTIQQIMEDD